MKTLKRVIYLITALLIIASTNSVAQSKLIEKIEVKPGELKIPYEKWQLENGLILIIHEDHSDPIAHVDVTYHVGSAREEIGKSGFAHFFEHMMFQGSENVEDDEHFKIIATAGGNMNGTTNRDRTNYFQTLPSNHLEMAIWLEADRMGLMVEAVTKEKFENQRETVKNEKGIGLNSPYGMVPEILGQLLYPPGHPYSWPVIGYVDDLDRVQVDALKKFFLRWYGPNNAVISIAGDVDPKNVLALVEKYFGPIKRGPEVNKQKVPLPILPIDRYTNYADNIYFPLTLMVFPTIPNFHRDEAPLDMLAAILGGGNNSIFYERFVDEEIAIQAGVGHPCSELAGEFTISVVAYPDQSFNDIEEEIRKCIKDAEAEITDDAVTRVKAVMRSNLIDVLGSVGAKANQLSSWEWMLPTRVYNLDDDLKRYAAVSTADVKRVFNKYIRNRNAAIVNVHAKDPEAKDSIVSINPNASSISEVELTGEGKGHWEYQKPDYSFDKSVRPTAGPAGTPPIPDFYTTKFDNGMEVIGTKSTEVPKINIMLEMKGGKMADDPKLIGVARMTANMLGESTENYDTKEISAELDRMGSSIYFGSGNSNNTVFLECFPEHLDATLKLFEEKLMHPAFKAEDFKTLKKQTTEGMNARTTNANTSASEAYNNLIYGDNIRGSFANAKMIRKINLDDIKAYYAANYSPAGASLVIVGDVDESVIMSKLGFLKDWKGKEVTFTEPTDYPEHTKTQIYLVHKPRSPQSVIWVGHLGMKYDYDGEYFRSQVMNFALGGNFNSRLNLNLREDKGYTYGIRSNFGGGHMTGTFTISTSVRRSATDSALREIMMEIENYVNNGITAEELDFTKSALLNNDVMGFETPFQKVGFLNQIANYDLPRDYTLQQSELLKVMTIEQINALAKEKIDPNKMVIVVVGNKYMIKKPLEDLGYGKVKEITIN